MWRSLYMTDMQWDHVPILVMLGVVSSLLLLPPTARLQAGAVLSVILLVGPLVYFALNPARS